MFIQWLIGGLGGWFGIPGIPLSNNPFIHINFHIHALKKHMRNLLKSSIAPLERFVLARKKKTKMCWSIETPTEKMARFRLHLPHPIIISFGRVFFHPTPKTPSKYDCLQKSLKQFVPLSPQTPPANIAPKGIMDVAYKFSSGCAPGTCCRRPATETWWFCHDD